MVGGAPAALEHVMVIGGSIVASAHGVFFQIRRGALHVDDIARIQAAGLRHRSRIARDARYGAMFLTEPGALIPTEPVRARQRAIVGEMLKDPRTRMAVLIVGESVDATMLRSASRAVIPSHPQLRVFGMVDNACEWLAEEVEIPAASIAASLREARARAERELGTS